MHIGVAPMCIGVGGILFLTVNCVYCFELLRVFAEAIGAMLYLVLTAEKQKRKGEGLCIKGKQIIAFHFVREFACVVSVSWVRLFVCVLFFFVFGSLCGFVYAAPLNLRTTRHGYFFFLFLAIVMVVPHSRFLLLLQNVYFSTSHMIH